MIAIAPWSAAMISAEFSSPPAELPTADLAAKPAGPDAAELPSPEECYARLATFRPSWGILAAPLLWALIDRGLPLPRPWNTAELPPRPSPDGPPKGREDTRSDPVQVRPPADLVESSEVVPSWLRAQLSAQFSGRTRAAEVEALEAVAAKKAELLAQLQSRTRTIVAEPTAIEPPKPSGGPP